MGKTWEEIITAIIQEDAEGNGEAPEEYCNRRIKLIKSPAPPEAKIRQEIE